MNSLYSATAKQQITAASLGNQFVSTQLTKVFPRRSFSAGVRRALLRRVATIDVWARQQKRLSSEEFYQSHVNAIFMGLYAEILAGVLAGIGSISLFGMWAVR
jgi:hypothetical protein